MRQNHVTLPALDYAQSVDFYTRLGLIQIVDAPPRYARFECPAGDAGGAPATLSIERIPDWPGADWPLIYLEVDDLDAVLAALAASGITPLRPPETKRYLWREADVRDPAGNRLRLYHAGDARRFPPWRVGDAGSGR